MRRIEPFDKNAPFMLDWSDREVVIDFCKHLNAFKSGSYCNFCVVQVDGIKQFNIVRKEDLEEKFNQHIKYKIIYEPDHYHR